MKKKGAAGEGAAGTMTTRSRSDSLLRRTRSGRIIAAAVRRYRGSIDVGDGDDPSAARPFPIKHLRTHRVFSSAPCSRQHEDLATPPHPGKGLETEKIQQQQEEEQLQKMEETETRPHPSVDVACILPDENFEAKNPPSFPQQPLLPAATPADGGDEDRPPTDMELLPAYGGDEGRPSTDMEIQLADQPRSTPVLVPCSRLKVFSNPTSHCYRRLLPFLLDITKSNSRTLEIVSTKKQTKKIENDLALKPLVSVPAPLSIEGMPQMQEEIVPVQHKSIEDAITEDPENNAQQTCILENFDNMSLCEPQFLCKSYTITTPAMHEDLTVEELTGVSTNHNSGKCHSTHLSGLGRCATSVKGILKRSRGGCKGPCTCLDCASFRLHAERAFEFSKKQMNETQDVTMGILKELSALRKLVADSVVPFVGKEGYAILQLNQVQVQDACRRALEAEMVARNRLREMALDLGVHCRITRQIQHKVTFMDHGEDKSLDK